MKYKLLSYLAVAVTVLTGANAMAGNTANTIQKPVSKVSEVQNMADDSMVYVQGYIVQNLGNENYIFQDDSGQIAVEIDDNLINSATLAPETVVWIAAVVDKETGQPVALEAEEVQIIPANSNASMTMSSNTNN